MRSPCHPLFAGDCRAVIKGPLIPDLCSSICTGLAAFSSLSGCFLALFAGVIWTGGFAPLRRGRGFCLLLKRHHTGEPHQGQTLLCSLGCSHLFPPQRAVELARTALRNPLHPLFILFFFLFSPFSSPFCFCLFGCFWVTPTNARGLTLAMHSAITPDSVFFGGGYGGKLIRDDGDLTQVGFFQCNQSFTYSPTYLPNPSPLAIFSSSG